MSLFRSQKGHGSERPSVLIQLRLVDKLGVPIDASQAWLALQAAFKNHAHLEVFQVEVRPDKDAQTSISEK